MNLKLLFTIILLIIGNFLFAQSINPEHGKYIDSLTSHWSRPDLPGGAIGIIHNGNVLLKKTSGKANLALSQPITDKTPFQLAQISDNFIAYAILKLHYNKTISLDDKVSSYLPYLDNLTDELRIKHLLQQSSGIQDYEILKNIACWGDNADFSKEDAIRLIATQKQLCFEPGSTFSNSRSNMLIASEIISKASKLTFPDYMVKHVFQPLGMVNTFIVTSENQGLSEVALSYRVDEEGLAVQIPSKKQTYAGINIFSSLDDMLKWEMNLLNPSDDTKATVDHYLSYVTLEDGSQFSVPSGKLIYGQRNIHKERGIETTMSTGGIDGFASAVFNFPSENYTVVTVSNNGEGYNGYIGMLATHAILDKAFTEPTSIDFSKIKTVPFDRQVHKVYEGIYWDALGEFSRELTVENDTLHYVRPGGNKTALIPLSRNTFQMKTDFDDEVILTFYEDKENGIYMDYAFAEATPFRFVKYYPKKIDTKKLVAKYSGDYYCKELGVGYKIDAENNRLKASNVKMNSINFDYIFQEVFSSDKWYLGSIEFVLDSDQKVQGFFVRNDAIRNLYFEKNTD